MDYQQLVCTQEGPDTCGIAALRTALNFYGIKRPEQELVRQLNDSGLEVMDFGVYTPQVGLLALKNGLATVLHLNRNKLARLKHEVKYKESLDAFLAAGGSLSEHDDGPTFPLVKALLNKGSVLLVRVTGREYYGMRKEDWGHYLVFVSTPYGHEILDCFKQKGFEFYKNWEKHIKLSEKYDWLQWKDDIIELAR
ncbi:hypothetical protein HY546_01270 [archaeon]|nr:hypothetical protein [archaeon]